VSAAGARRLREFRAPDWAVGLAFVSPWIIGFLVFLALPIGMSLYYSLTDYSMLEEPVWVGLDNYTALASDSVFWKSVWNTVFFAALSLPITTVVAIVLAALLASKPRGTGWFRAAIFVPSLVPMVASAMVWMWLLNAELGLINRILQPMLDTLAAAVGGNLLAPNWLEDKAWVMPALVLTTVWSVGHSVVIYGAALEEVPKALYEAAELDGVGPVRKLTAVTLPMISPVILFNVIVGAIGAWQVFVMPYIMLGSSGGPDRAGYFYTMYLYDKAFPFGEMGYASAMAWIQLLIVMVFTGVIFLSSKKLVHYRGA